MIVVKIIDLDTMKNNVIKVHKKDLTYHPFERMKFFIDVNRLISKFIDECIGKTKKTMKQLDKEK